MNLCVMRVGRQLSLLGGKNPIATSLCDRRRAIIVSCASREALNPKFTRAACPHPPSQDAQRRADVQRRLSLLVSVTEEWFNTGGSHPPWLLASCCVARRLCSTRISVNPCITLNPPNGGPGRIRRILGFWPRRRPAFLWKTSIFGTFGAIWRN